MRTFLVACAAAVLMAVGAAYVLNGYVPDLSSAAFTTSGARI